MCRIRIPRTGSAPRHRSRTADLSASEGPVRGAVRRGFEGRSNERAAVAVGPRLLELGDVAAAYLVERDDVRSPLVDDRSGRSHRPAGITARDSAVAQIQLSARNDGPVAPREIVRRFTPLGKLSARLGMPAPVNQTTDDARQPRSQRFPPPGYRSISHTTAQPTRVGAVRRFTYGGSTGDVGSAGGCTRSARCWSSVTAHVQLGEHEPQRTQRVVAGIVI
jgi:hypothetical protein